MRILAFVILTIVGTAAGLAVGANETSPYARAARMQEKGFAGAVCGMIAGGIAIWITGEKKKP